jgi:hypothetical protein
MATAPQQEQHRRTRPPMRDDNDQERARDEQKQARLSYLNKAGEMLMAEVKIQRKTGAPDPLFVNVNEESMAIKRGFPVIVPWYVATSLRDRVERTYRQEKDPATNRTVIVEEEQMADTFDCRWLDPVGETPF